MTGAALFRVETVEPYPESYGSATEIVKDELQRGVIRPIRPLAFNPDDYDVVVLATPTWWHHAAMPLQTWIRSVDLSAKKILTANTHGAAASCTPARPSRRCSQAAGSARTSRSTGPCARRTQRSGKRLSLTPETQSRTGIRHGRIEPSNSVKMPAMNFGVYWITDPTECEAAVLSAWRGIDTAASYLNERAVGRAVARSGIPYSTLHLHEALGAGHFRSGRRARHQALARAAQNRHDRLVPDPSALWRHLWRMAHDGAVYEAGDLRGDRREQLPAPTASRTWRSTIAFARRSIRLK